MWLLDSRSEFDVQWQAFTNLRRAGYSVKGEVRFKLPGKRGVRADILVLVKGEPRVIVEVKRKDSCARQSKQSKRYTETTGLPVVVVCGMQGAYSVVRWVADHLHGDK